MEEIWKPISCFEGLYKVSNLGRILKLSNNFILKPWKNKKGYLRVKLWKDGTCITKVVHLLVAEAFILKTGDEINHKDENKENNSVFNLEWCSRIYNCNYGTRSQRLSKALINNQYKSKKILKCDIQGHIIKIYPSTSEVERQEGIHHSLISRYCKRNIDKVFIINNIIWKYGEE